ncbi:hypothetical protein B0J11DRAFT_527992 [Dendryphion nanum]|uniref:Uncharacterized protein n=1 Tax=Dendryphion nanum TaxID=256645 RepID=A0A9P9IN75_9PLEO|nr:hypothetical protein B0J11DRAFT_527992 [Dendryphion nanum]
MRDRAGAPGHLWAASGAMGSGDPVPSQRPGWGGNRAGRVQGKCRPGQGRHDRLTDREREARERATLALSCCLREPEGDPVQGTSWHGEKNSHHPSNSSISLPLLRRNSASPVDPPDPPPASRPVVQPQQQCSGPVGLVVPVVAAVVVGSGSCT